MADREKERDWLRNLSIKSLKSWSIMEMLESSVGKCFDLHKVSKQKHKDVGTK